MDPVVKPLRDINEGVSDSLKDQLKSCDYLRFTTHDVNGIPRGLLVPGRRVLECLDSGLPLFSGINAYGPNNELVFPPEVVATNLANGILFPDLSSFHYTPWIGEEKHTFGQVLCEMMWNESRPQEASARYAARKQIERLRGMGYDLLSGIEWEYALSEKGTRKPLFKQHNYTVSLLYAEFDSWFIDVDQAMLKAGVRTSTMHPEYGQAQLEFSTVPEIGLKGIDNSVIMKQGIREMALKRGWQASFMARDIGSENGNGAHFSFSIWNRKTGANGFYDDTASDGVSSVGRHWVGGMIKHAAAISALCCPSTNCYHRLHGPWAPHLANWGFEDRNAMLRVKNKGPQGTYIENRLPSSLGNPYLVAAATIAAGIDGVLKKIPCPEVGDIDAAVVLPHSLKESLEALQKDEAIVNALGKEFVDWFVLLRTETDLKAISDAKDEHERILKEDEEYFYLC